MHASEYETNKSKTLKKPIIFKAHAQRRSQCPVPSIKLESIW